MTEQLPNRIEMELSQLKSREDRLRKLFPSDVLKDNSLIAEKVKFYQHILLKYKDTKSTDELYVLRMIDKERIKLTKQLYPNILNQLLRKVFNVLIVSKMQLKYYEKELQDNNRHLYDQLAKIGNKDAFVKIQPLINKGQMEITVPASRYINEKERFDQDLFFSKDANRQYKFEGFKAILHNELKPEENRSHFFKPDNYGFTSTEAYNLLAGRALEKEGRWVQFDLNDKDASGNYRLKEFHTDYGYNLEKILSKLPLKELNNNFMTEKLLDRLKDGHLEAVTVIKNNVEQKIYIEANPHFKTLNFYDLNSKKISLSGVLKDNSPKAIENLKKPIVLKSIRNVKKVTARLR